MSIELRPRASRRAKISALGTYVPPRVLTNADLAKLVDTSDEWIMQRLGIRERHLVEPEWAPAICPWKRHAVALPSEASRPAK